MSYLWTIIKGILMGIGNIIPGVSGGTMAVSLGIYDDLIFSITHLFSKWRKSLKFLAPLGAGLATGIVFFSYAIETLLSQYTLLTGLAFVGLILGGLPILFKSFKMSLRRNNERIKVSHIVIFLVFFALVIGMALIQEGEASFSPLEMNLANVIILFFIGIIASATMVIPGISGSLILMVIGYYYSIINTLTTFFTGLQTFDINAILYGVSLLLPFGIGVLLGIFLISKVIEYLFINFSSLTYSGILGLVIASPFAVIYNTNALTDLNGPNSVVFTIVGLALLLICFYVTYALGKTEELDTDIES